MHLIDLSDLVKPQSRLQRDSCVFAVVWTEGLRDIDSHRLVKVRSSAWVPVVVDAHAAGAGITNVLLDVGRSPAAEVLEVREGRFVVVVGVPDGEPLGVGVRPAAADDLRPAVPVCVNAALDT